MKKFLFGLMLTGCLVTNNYADDESNESSDNQKELINAIYTKNNNMFIEEKLFSQPMQNGHSTIGTLCKYIAPLLGITTTTYFFKKKLISKIIDLEDEISLKKIKKIAWPFFSAATLASLAAITLYKGSEHFIDKPLRQKNLQINAFKDFVENWPTYKEYTPQDLHKFFDGFYQEVQNGESIDEIIPEAIEKLRTFLSL